MILGGLWDISLIGNLIAASALQGEKKISKSNEKMRTTYIFWRNIWGRLCEFGGSWPGVRSLVSNFPYFLVAAAVVWVMEWGMGAWVCLLPNLENL